MVSDSVKDIVEDFNLRWRRIAERAPVLRLDGGWPSVGILDLLTYGARGVANLADQERELVRVAAASLATMTERCWSRFGVTVTADLGERGVFVEARDQRSGSSQVVFSVEIEQELAKILQAPQHPFPILGSYARPIGREQNLVSPFALGLLVGLTPYGDGRWLAETPESFRENIDSAVKELARSSAERYEILFPREQLGQVAELYLNNLIYPPTMMEESIPLGGAVMGMLEFFREYQVSREQMRQVAHNLALSSDDTLAHAGLVFYGALSNRIPPPEVIAAAESRGTYMGVLRGAMIALRAELGEERDWLTDSGFVQGDSERFDLEAVMGFLPWLRISKERFRRRKGDAELGALCFALATFDMPESVKILDRMLDLNPGDLELRLQRVYLDMLNGEAELACDKFRSLLSEPGAEKEVSLFGLWGLAALALGDFEEAELRLGEGFRLINPGDPVQSYQIANNYAWTLILKEKFEKALEILEFATKRSHCPVTGLLNKAYLYLVQGREEEATAIHQQLLELYPLDRRVFGNIVLESDA